MNPKDIRQKAAEIQGERRDVEVATKAVTVNEEKHTATFVMSTASKDRHNEVVEQESWKLEHFLENPAFFWGHKSNEFPLGKWLDIHLEDDPQLEGKQMLVGTAEFAVDVHPDIQRAWDHVKRGDLNMVSVGFIPHVVDYDEDREVFVLKNCELMECSLVGIGANRRALVKAETDDPRDRLIEVKSELEEEVKQAPADPSVVRKIKANYHLNKAIRQLQK